MRSFAVYLRRIQDGRAPEYVNLEQEYKKSGVLEAENIRRLEHLLATSVEITSKFTGESRRVQVGDVVIPLDTKIAVIYTATGAWAAVKLTKE